jgi:hypothetical protein
LKSPSETVIIKGSNWRWRNRDYFYNGLEKSFDSIYGRTKYD